LAGKTKDEKYDKIKDKKVSTTIESLTRGLPEEFNLYLNYCRGLKFEEKPDYGYCRKLFKDFMQRSNIDNDFAYDWVIKRNGGTINKTETVKPLVNADMGAMKYAAPEVEERKDNGRYLSGANATANGFRQQQED
jgi:hypothetical protein